jgi:hypothetical protein
MDVVDKDEYLEWNSLFKFSLTISLSKGNSCLPNESEGI